jgi:hypothetical protein
LDNLASILSLDYAYLGDQLVRGGLSAFLSVPDMLSTMNSFINDPSPDYFEGGKAFGKIWKQVFDMNLAN